MTEVEYDFDEFDDCPFCDSTSCMDVAEKDVSFPYATAFQDGVASDFVEVRVRVPVSTCTVCGAQFEGHDADVIRDKAISDIRTRLAQ